MRAGRQLNEMNQDETKGINERIALHLHLQLHCVDAKWLRRCINNYLRYTWNPVVGERAGRGRTVYVCKGLLW